MAAAHIVDSYELSPMQEGMLFHALLEESGGVNHEQILLTIRGTLDVGAFLAAFDALVARHPILRTRFSYDDAGRPVQEVIETAEIPIAHVDLTSADHSTRTKRFDEIVSADLAEPIDLGQAPAMRLNIVDWSSEEHRVIWTYHHALIDGRSLALLLGELLSFYEARSVGRELDPPLPRPYREYIEFLRGLDLAVAEAYWRRKLSGFSAPTPLGIDRAQRSTRSGRSRSQGVSEHRLSREVTAELRAFAASQGGLVGVTLNNLVQAAWAVLLQRYSGQQDVVFGATRAGRPSVFPDAGEMVGLFINTLPLRVNVDPERRLGELLGDLRTLQFELRNYEHTPLAKIQGWSDLPRGEALFETLVVYDERRPGELLRDLDPAGSWAATVHHQQTNYPLTLVVYGEEQMLLRLESDRSRLDDAAASRMLEQLVTILTAMPEHAEGKLRELPLFVVWGGWLGLVWLVVVVVGVCMSGLRVGLGWVRSGWLWCVVGSRGRVGGWIGGRMGWR